MGGTLSYTRGQFKDARSDWRELNALQVSPVKGTLFAEWNDHQDHRLRVQMLAVKGTDQAYKDSLVATYDENVRPNAATKIKGYAIMDMIAETKLGFGTVAFAIYNVWNTEYKTVFSQAAEAVYGAISSLAAQGRTYSLSYTLKY